MLVAGLELTTSKLLIYLVNNDFEFELTNNTYNRAKEFNQYNQQISSRFAIAEPIDDKVYETKIEFAKGHGLAI